MLVKMMVHVSFYLLLFATYTLAKTGKTCHMSLAINADVCKLGETGNTCHNLLAIYDDMCKLGETDEELCTTRADVALVLDDSISISKDDFKLELDFSKALVEHFQVSDAWARFAAVTFGSGSKEVFPFGKFNTTVKVIRAINKIIKRNGNTTDIFAGIKYATETLFKVPRIAAAKVLILLTDGLSQRMYDSIEEAYSAFSKAITVIVIGVGSFDKTELAKLSSHPSEKYMFVVPAFANLTGIRSLIADHICKAPAVPPCDTEVKQECKGKILDLVFVIDRSTSLGRANFTAQINFLTNVTDNFDIGPNTTRVAVVSFSSDVHVEFYLDEYTSKHALIDKINNIKYTGGNTEIWAALTAVRDYVCVKRRGLRDNVDKVVILVTDGAAQEVDMTRAMATSLRDKGFQLFFVGVGSQIDMEELKILGSRPSKKYVFEVTAFDGLKIFKNTIALGSCIS